MQNLAAVFKCGESIHSSHWLFSIKETVVAIGTILHSICVCVYLLLSLQVYVHKFVFDLHGRQRLYWYTQLKLSICVCAPDASF